MVLNEWKCKRKLVSQRSANSFVLQILAISNAAMHLRTKKIGDCVFILEFDTNADAANLLVPV